MPTNDAEFPRGKGIPSQTPLFWASNKDRYLRQLLIADTEEITGRDLVVMFHARSPYAQIQPDDVAPLAEVLSQCRRKEFDLLLETPGGLVDSTEAICTLLRNQSKPYRVIVPGYAKSGGTVISLSADEIVMGPTSELGPVDPALWDYPVEFLEGIESDRRREIGNLQNDPSQALQIDRLFWQAEQAKKQMQGLAKKMLLTGCMKGKSDEECQKTTDEIATRKRFNSHGAAIDCSEATKLGLNVRSLGPDDELWKRFWLIWTTYHFDSQLFGLDKMFECSTASQFIQYPK